MTLTLTELLGGRKVAGDVRISGMTVDSRAVRPGDLFVALPGTKMDGRTFIRDAVAKGATAILTTPHGAPDDIGVPVVEDQNPRRRYADLASRYYHAQPETMVAVTGTNGKTSVADFTRQIWQHLGLEAASVGTLGVRSEHVNVSGGLTTPDPMALHAALKDLADAGVTHAAIEASSHGLDQYRLDGVHLKAAAFTNLTRDHMDYHKTEQGYFFAKARLFGELLAPGSTAVINVDDPWGQILEDIVWARGLVSLSVGTGEGAKIRLTGQTVNQTGQEITVTHAGLTHKINLPLVGFFQAGNALVAAGLAIATGADPVDAFAALAHLRGVPGRMELIGKSKSGGAVFVDYAHTPDGLKTVLQAARAHNPKRLLVVFGCGGDRDSGKRPQMGALAAALADKVFVTDDNPRSEDAAAIRAEIMAASEHATEIGDRGEAIRTAIRELEHGDMLIVAGKGHEEGQIVGDKILPFSDIEAVRAILAGEGE
ncbi:UDP-N-acetylmuramoyl-L-alanyl-D-glutamate--2,6-diaminopimelate ligase [Kordiimonas marina]|uniref:UDP-N-acetylmuramoyl-L-alanyl-D-glutamate--2, 6-diaminopimelate ligase n=1 Tax=Kordiimonas marina TaxID=2872312 RepID=UPI001FF589D0|nr:UDP-N-acetylmuramoyl-L-alanyl-D-glutamate--2,6-diaminopimelate ligase [Kordiimonas marina]MCJ9429478.1 UDP-N-acetylmuramoyl-L-alanyl-D-glutamate--2,6-diaminopimelate ligase [Kordiimonas marina]